MQTHFLSAVVKECHSWTDVLLAIMSKWDDISIRTCPVFKNMHFNCKCWQPISQIGQ